MKNLGQMPNLPGIYAIDSPLGAYVGRAKNLRARGKRHLTNLKNRTHPNHNLQRAFDAGPDKLIIKSLEIAPVLCADDLDIWLGRRETFWRMRHGDHLNIEKAKVAAFDHFKHTTLKREIEQLRTDLSSDLKDQKSKHQNAQKEYEKFRSEFSDEQKHLSVECDKAGNSRHKQSAFAAGLAVLLGVVFQIPSLTIASFLVAGYLCFVTSPKQKTIEKKLRQLEQRARRISCAVKSYGGEVQGSESRLLGLNKAIADLVNDEEIFFRKRLYPVEAAKWLCDHPERSLNDYCVTVEASPLDIWPLFKNENFQSYLSQRFLTIHPSCPVCGGESARIVWGLVNPDYRLHLTAAELSENLANRVILGGCMVGDAEFQCCNCRHEWCETKFRTERKA